MRKLFVFTFALLLFATAAQAETWKIDPDHSAAHFAIEHMMIAKVRGSFPDMQGTLEFKYGMPGAFAVTIAVDSLDTGVDKRDAHLKSGDFFEAATYPTMTFASSELTKTPEGFDATGILTIKGVAHSVTFAVTGLNDQFKDPWGNMRRGGRAEVVIDRRDFGVSWNQAIEGGGLMIGNDVEIVVDFELLQSN